ncbi:MAG: steroid 5-alpha reductase family enzyme [Patiriisocius sp.]|jgi:steroid 5-alpha reductase family enzyme
MVLLILSITFVIFCFVSTLFLVSIIIKRNDIADIAWGTGIFIVAITGHILTASPSLLSIALLILAGLWGIRLTLRIFLRNIKKGEDPRYKKWREQWGAWFYPRSYLQVYLLQGFLMIVVGYPFVHASLASTDYQPGVFFAVGLIVWLLGYVFEVAGDFQLDRFLKNPENRGSIMNKGLWNYTRHPNYFGEVTMWWGIFLMVCTLPFGFMALISPLMITFLILKVSGIPMLEAGFKDNVDFQVYKKKTNAFFPWFPKQ